MPESQTGTSCVVTVSTVTGTAGLAACAGIRAEGAGIAHCQIAAAAPASTIPARATHGSSRLEPDDRGPDLTEFSKGCPPAFPPVQPALRGNPHERGGFDHDVKAAAQRAKQSDDRLQSQ